MPYRFRAEGPVRYENSDHHEKEIQEQAKRDARDETRLRVEKGVFLVGVLGIGGLLYTLYLTRVATNVATEAANAAKQQVIVMQQQVVAAERPWISADVGLIEPLRTRGGVVEVRVFLKNVGRSVATEVRVKVKIVLYHWSKVLTPDWSPDEIRQGSKELCEDLRQSRLVEGGGLSFFQISKASLRPALDWGG